jgi:transcriptional regulator with XRE-family HTH domain
MPVNEGLGERIRMARELVGMSQAELARRIGISKNAMNDIETGDTDPRASRITAIALALEVSTDMLLGLKVAHERIKRDQHTLEYYNETAHLIPVSTPTPTTPKRRRPSAPVG